MNLETPRRGPGRRGPGAELSGEDPRPVVALPNPGVPGIAIAGVAALAAILLFLILDGQRRRPLPQPVVSDGNQSGAFAPPPTLLLTPEAEPAPVPEPLISIPIIPRDMPVRQVRASPPAPFVSPTVSSPPQAWIAPEQIPAQPPVEAGEPALIYDGGMPTSDGQPAEKTGPANRDGPVDPSRKGSATAPPSRLTRIANPTTVVATGTLIKAVLETPIDTSRPGFARAVVSSGARGFNGRRILIPRGSRLIGEYEADVRMGQRKVLVNWTQLIRPDGTMMNLESPGADAMGGAGIPGRVNNFFFERFANAVLQSALTVGGSLSTWSNNAPVIVGFPTSGINPGTMAGQAGLIGQAPPPRITVKQGAAFNVFVARDLDFSETGSAR